MLQYILTDIEGTTTKIDFVHKTLFPFFVDNIDLLDACDNTTKRDEAYQAIQETTWQEEGIKLESIAAIKAQLIHYVSIDRKHPALKNLQGLVWQIGYTEGILKAHLYKDVLANLKLWKSMGLQLGVYSSGSVQAQHLLFENSVEGNLKNLFSNFYDTQVGHKRDEESYKNIIKDLSIDANEILFLSDIEEELSAAKKVGINGVLLCRDQKNELSQFTVASSFDEVSTFIKKNYGI